MNKLIIIKSQKRYYWIFPFILFVFMFLNISGTSYAACVAGDGGGGDPGAIGGDATAGCTGTAKGGGGGGGGGSRAGGNGTAGAGGGVLLKNTAGTMTISGTIDNRGGGSSATNGGTVKLFYTGTAPSTTGVTSGRTYSAVATSQTSSTCEPSIAANDASSGTVAWTSPSNATSLNTFSATSISSSVSTQTSYKLNLTGCGFSLPSNASVSGVKVDFYRQSDAVPVLGGSYDASVNLIKGGTVLSTDRSSGVQWSTTFAWDAYGGNTDLWGTTLTYTDVNASNFGVSIAANNTWSTTNSVGARSYIDTANITVYYTIVTNFAPAAPTLSSPASGATGVAGAPSFQLKTTDADNDYLRYEVVIYQSDCTTVVRTIDQTSSQTGWTGQDTQASTAYIGNSVIGSSTLANHNYQFPSLAPSTIYCWKGRAIDPAGTNTFSTYSATQNFTTAAQSTPSIPTLLSPASGATGTSISPLFQFRSSDADNDYLRYKVLVYNSDCTTGLQTFDQTLSQTGWLSQDQQAATAYTGNSVLANSTIATYGGANLTANTQYCWKAAAIDPAGTNTFSAYSATQLFTTGAATGNVNINGGVNIRGGSLIR